MMDEETLLFKFLEEFLENGFPYLSVLEGGFNEVNRILHEVHVEILNHNAEKCGVCNGRSGEKKNSLFTFFNKVFDKTGNNNFFHKIILDGRNNPLILFPL